METGYLRVTTSEAYQAAPVGGVTVTVTTEDGDAYSFITGPCGRSDPIPPSAPDRALSLDEGNTRRPYAVVGIAAQKEGCYPVLKTGV